MHKPPIIILVRPQLGENIGATARVMANFGLKDLRLVAPRDGWPSETADAMAAGAQYILREAPLFDTLEEALKDCHVVYATTSRDRRLNKAVAEPREAFAVITRRISEGQKVALVFGPERTGLDNEDISFASHLLTIPVSPDYPSLNLAQAVGICTYEWQMQQQAVLDEPTECASPPCYAGELSQEALGKGADNKPEAHAPATREELFGFFAHLEEVLGESGFYKTPEIKPNMDRNLRALFQRAELTSQEIATLRGILRSLTNPIENPRWKSLKNNDKKSA